MLLAKRWMMSVAVAAVGTVLINIPAARAQDADGKFGVPSKDSPELQWWRDSMKTHDERMAWWREARFGMFIHWGAYSSLGGTYNGQPVKGYAEHIMRILKIPVKDYREQIAANFNPVNFNADEWAKMAHDAGVGYLIITSKHHDGFAMYDSKASDYNVVKASKWHHDPMKDLKAACDKYGIKFGFYYSQAFDWEHPDAAGNDWDYDNPGGGKLLHGGPNWWNTSPELTEKTEKYVQQKAIPQVRELIAQYHPALIWFDTPGKIPPSQNLEILKAARETGPDVVYNSRCVRNLGDYLSTADRPAEFVSHDGDWEGIPTTNESYGWNRNDHSHKPASHFVKLLAKACARGGNTMLNFGPRGDGTFDPPDVEILKGIAAWMKVNGDSIHGTTRTPLAVQAWGESTRKGNKLYLHVFDWPRDGKLVVGGVKSEVTHAYLLGDASKATLPTRKSGMGDLEIAVPTAPPDATDSVVVLETSGSTIDADPTRLLSATQDNELRVFDGDLVGKTIKFGAGKKENAYVEDWTHAGDGVSWKVRVAQPTAFDLSASYDAPAASEGAQFSITVDGGQPIAVTAKNGKNLVEPLGKITLQPGEHEIRAGAIKIVGPEFVHLRGVALRPDLK